MKFWYVLESYRLYNISIFNFIYVIIIMVKNLWWGTYNLHKLINKNVSYNSNVFSNSKSEQSK